MTPPPKPTTTTPTTTTTTTPTTTTTTTPTPTPTTTTTTTTPTTAHAAPTTSLVVTELRARGRGGLVLGPVSFAVDAGKPLAVLGTAGAGKSLLLATIAGLVRATTGSIIGTSTSRVAMVFQRDALDDAATAADNVAVAAHARGIPNARDAALRALARVGLQNDVDKRPRELSGGMKKRVGIARALVVEPTLILADDPTAGLDPETSEEVLALLFAANGVAIIIGTQDVDVVLPHAAHALVLDDGRVTFFGAPRALTGAFAIEPHEAREPPGARA